MSETLNNDPTNAHFLGQFQKLSGEAKKYRLKAKGYRDEVAQLRAQIDELLAEREEIAAGIEALEAERDEWRDRYEAHPSELQQELDRLNGELLQRDHRDAWKDLFGKPLNDEGLRLAEIAPDKLWTILGYKPEGSPDTARIKELVLQARASDPYLFQPAASPAAVPDGTKPDGSPPSPPRRQPLPPGPGASRGTVHQEEGVFTVTRAQMADPAWTFANQSKVAAAHKAGLLRFAEDLASAAG